MSFCHIFQKQNHTLILYINKILFLYFCFRSWTRERKLKQLSRGLHAINRALNFFNFFWGKRNASQDKTKAKTRKLKGPHFVSKTTCFVVVFSSLFCCCWYFPFLSWTTRHCRIAYTTCLPCLWMWKYSDTHSSFNICLGSFHLLKSSQVKQSTQKVFFCILQAPT